MSKTAGQANNARKGATRFDVYGDGSIMYLYDPANAEAILDLVPEDDPYPLDQRNLGDAVRVGLILLVELFQDDELRFEMAIGPPLTAGEKEGLPWLACTHGQLSLPSGTLRVDSANSLALIPEESDARGAEIQCDPGHYRISIDRLSWGELDEAHHHHGADQVITLEKIAEKQFVGNERVLIPAEPWPTVSTTEEKPPSFWNRPVPSGGVDGRVFRGHVRFDSDNFWLNLSPPSAERLGLKHVGADQSGNQLSDLVLIEIPEMDLEIRGCINGYTYFDMSKAELRMVGTYVATGLPMPCLFFGQAHEMIRFSWDTKGRKIAQADVERWYEATLEVV